MSAYMARRLLLSLVSDPRLDLSIFTISEEDFRKYNPPTISICLSRWRKLHPETVPVEAKVAANYLNGMLARQDAQRRGFDLGSARPTGFLAESSVESVFMVKDGVLMTPPLGNFCPVLPVVPFLKRRRPLGLRPRKDPSPPGNSGGRGDFYFQYLARVWPVSRFEERLLKEEPGPVTRQLSAFIENICSGRDERFRHWLYPIK